LTFVYRHLLFGRELCSVSGELEKTVARAAILTNRPTFAVGRSYSGRKTSLPWHWVHLEIRLGQLFAL